MFYIFASNSGKIRPIFFKPSPLFEPMFFAYFYGLICLWKFYFHIEIVELSKKIKIGRSPFRAYNSGFRLTIWLKFFSSYSLSHDEHFGI
jgi:hypothetical protein